MSWPWMVLVTLGLIGAVACSTPVRGTSVDDAGSVLVDAASSRPDGATTHDAGVADSGRIDPGADAGPGVDAGVSLTVVGSIGSGGGAASAGTYALVDHGFEGMAPMCSASGSLCVVGGFVP